MEKQSTSKRHQRVFAEVEYYEILGVLPCLVGALVLTPPCNQHSNQLNPGKDDQLPHGLAAAETAKPLELGTESSISSSIDGTVCASQNFIMFLAAAIAFDFCFKTMVYKSFSYK
ncbi:hypothetical protein MUK42_36419 [Musa troglodytarum]|uniref:Uncharacterized protein n=1 Tax=Musa troglodytarum TaxID=320322 RepID=A0A9E7JCC7_9LILI|nr:hypothetical protein MUK42_36419 [Musa troglodytarum]